MFLRREYAISIFFVAGLAVAVTGGILVGIYSVDGINPIYTQLRDPSILADKVASEYDLFGTSPPAYGAADPTDDPPAYLSLYTVAREPPGADTPGV